MLYASLKIWKEERGRVCQDDNTIGTGVYFLERLQHQLREWEREEPVTGNEAQAMRQNC